MTLEMQAQQPVVEATKLLASSLPIDGKVEVLNHLLETLSAADLNGLTPEARGALLQVLPEPITTKSIRNVITQAGGIFVGRDELLKLGKISVEVRVPELPIAIEAFLQATHPIRGGTIASHVIIGVDPVSNEWHCIDRGNGGASDIVPGSLGDDELYIYGLSGTAQDLLLQKNGTQIEVNGAVLSSPTDYQPVKRVIDSAIELHLRAGKPITSAPFYNISARTADTDHAIENCRVFIGYPNENGISVFGNFMDSDNFNDLGLLACWSLKNIGVATHRGLNIEVKREDEGSLVLVVTRQSAEP